MSDEQKTPKPGEWTEPPAIDPGEGYELLPVGTVLEDGDQFKLTRGWRDTESPGCTVDAGDCYRRKIKPSVTTGNAPPDTFKLTPVESPDDWVDITNQGHVLRAGVDMLSCCDGGFVGCQLNKWDGRTVAAYLHANDECRNKHVRCRRKDLPGAVPAVKRVPVRLWVSDRIGRADDEQWIVFAATGVPDKRSDTLKEILHDADGFYVEVTE